MKKVILLIVGLIAWNFTNAQETTCDPDLSVPDSVVVAPLPQSPSRPDGGIIDTACAGEYYKFVFTFNIPATYEVQGVTLPLDNVSIPVDGAIENLPASFDYVCNPPTCVFDAETKGCVVVFGTAADNEVASHDLKVSANVAVTGLPLPFELVLPGDLEPESHYYMVVKPAGSANCFMMNADEQFAAQFNIRSQPNPTSGWMQVQVDAEVGGTFDFFVSDLLGQRLHRERVTILPGENTIDFDGSHLPNGVYLYSLSNGRQVVTRKMAVNRR